MPVRSRTADPEPGARAGGDRRPRRRRPRSTGTPARCARCRRPTSLIEQAALAEIWTPAHLERLARTYWRFLTRITLGLIRVHYSEHERSVVLLARPLRLLTFLAPEYEIDPERGLVRWRIARGLLVVAPRA